MNTKLLKANAIAVCSVHPPTTMDTIAMSMIMKPDSNISKPPNCKQIPMYIYSDIPWILMHEETMRLMYSHTLK